MWKHMARVVREVRPEYVFVENSPMLTCRGLGTVLADLAALGFDAQWCVLSGAELGAPHLRERIWVVAHAMQNRRFHRVFNSHDGEKRAGTDPHIRRKDRIKSEMGSTRHAVFRKWASIPDPARVVDGVATRVDRLATTGNGQIPRVARTAFDVLNKEIFRT
jgi:DNA (cytosine-5)-methyltransferase 1